MRITRRLAITSLAACAVPAARAAQPAAGVQAPGYWRHRIGDIELTVVSDGVGGMPLAGLVLNAPLADVEQAMAEAFLPRDRFVTSYNTLVINTGGRVVLLDTGNGDMGPPTTGSWMANFRAAGFDPARVDTVVLTHLHPDHINGYRLRDGTAVFPNAETMAPAPEWAFWMDEAAMAGQPPRLQANARNAHRVLDPVASDVTRFDWGAEIAPGVTAIAAPGHTPGHTVFAIASGADRMMWLVDLTNNPDLLLRHPDWSPLFDVDAAMARDTRRRLADMVVAERMQVGFYHASFPATGHVLRDGAGYRLAPGLWSPQL